MIAPERAARDAAAWIEAIAWIASDEPEPVTIELLPAALAAIADHERRWRHRALRRAMKLPGYREATADDWRILQESAPPRRVAPGGDGGRAA